MCEILYRYHSTDCISEVSGYVDWIEVNGNRHDYMLIADPNRPEMYQGSMGEVVYIGK